MTSSTGDESPNSGASTLLGDAFQYWLGGLVLAGLIALVLGSRWLHGASHVYESRVVMALQAEASARPEDYQPESLARVLASAGQALHDSTSVRRLPDRRLALFCRDQEPRPAHDRCLTATTVVQQQLPALRVVDVASVPTRPLYPAQDATSVVVTWSMMIGALAGCAWMLVRAIGARRPRKKRAPSMKPPKRPHGVSFAPGPPANLTMVSPPDSRVALARRSEPQDAGSVIPLPVAHDWEMDPDLAQSQPAEYLARLRDQLCLAAADQCFVVGVSSAPEAEHLKSRLAAQLAWLLANLEQPRVLLLEVDFAHPNVDSVMSLDMPPLSGFSQQIQTQLRDGPGAPWIVVRCTSHLSVLAEGRVRAPGAVHSQLFAQAIAQLRHHFDLIVADGPSVGDVADTRAFEEVADGIVFVTSTREGSDEALAYASQWFHGQRLLAAATLSEPPPR